MPRSLFPPRIVSDSRLSLSASNLLETDVSTFRALFFGDGRCRKLRVPDYQRAYAWETKHVELFLRDLVQHQASGARYYFGHFIAESNGGHWELVDGQQRITTFLLFLAVCRWRLHDTAREEAFSLIEHFSTVSYDAEALACMLAKLSAFFGDYGGVGETRSPSGAQLKAAFDLTGSPTRSQSKLALALSHIHQAFERSDLIEAAIPGYIQVVMQAHASLHLTRDKAVAVKIFEMHNSRGVRLTALELLKAKLMKFVFEHSGPSREEYVRQIQKEFGAIFALEEALAASGFRGELTTDHLLRLHLRAVDDGRKRQATEFGVPVLNASEEDLIAYVDAKLRKEATAENATRPPEDKVRYALDLALELHTSMRIVTRLLPKWDGEAPLVGDVMVLDRDLSCQWFLIICRRLETGPGKADGRVDIETLKAWERLLFTRDFHEHHHNLKGTRDDFSLLFSEPMEDEKAIARGLQKYVQDGFRPDRTKNLQQIVADYINRNRANILRNAFHWWRHKMVYAIYKYETDHAVQLRTVMKGTVSVEHILPQDWEWKWLPNGDQLAEVDKEIQLKEVSGYIHGLGNLLVVTPSENTGLGNKHPADKQYRCHGGSYTDHDRNRERWRSSSEWPGLIEQRGEKIYRHMLSSLVGASPATPDTTQAVPASESPVVAMDERIVS